MQDLEFVQNCVNGDTRSWDEFLEKYSRLIYAYILSVANIKGIRPAPDELNDIFHEIIYALIKDNFKKLRSYQGKNGCSLASWLRQVTVNFTLDYARSLKPQVSIDDDREGAPNLKEALADGSIPIKDAIARQERLESLKDCIQRLDNEEKYFLALHLRGGMNLEEIRGLLKISRGAVDMRKSRIMDKLKKCFKNKGFRLGL